METDWTVTNGTAETKGERENQLWGPHSLSPCHLGLGGAMVQDAGSWGGLQLPRPLVLLLSPAQLAQAAQQ